VLIHATHATFAAATQLRDAAWLEDHTARENWLGGFKKDGENWTTLDALREILAPHFRLMDEPRDVPFVIRETRRKHQHTLAEATLWERIA
jgi:hypothetical protein